MALERVTSTSGSRIMLANLQRNYAKLTGIQTQISSGKQITRPSDSPAQVIAALDYRAQLKRAEQLDRNADDAAAWINTADSALTSAVERLHRVRDLTLQGVNGASDPVARQALAEEIRGIREGLLQIANTTYQQRPIFAGTINTPTAYSSTAVFQGNNGAVDRTIAPGQTVQVNLSAPSVFGTATVAPPAVPPAAYGGDVFQMLEQLANDVQAGVPAAGTTGLTAIDAALDRIQQGQATLGARANSVEQVRSRNEKVTLDLRAALAEVEDIDVPKTLIELSSQEMAYEAALSVTARVIQQSLLDFLR